MKLQLTRKPLKTLVLKRKVTPAKTKGSKYA